jgi:puromycin-sensitive aminopeptidase
MSTYLACIVVGPLSLTAPVMSRGVPMRIASRPDSVHLAAYANEVGARALAWYSDYFAMPYVERKLDQVAIPDFAAGAMENMGLITYRESLLLLDPQTATPVERSNVAGTVAHEIAHMWFGNTATMRWWNGIWLSEAFATFMSYLCVDGLEPSWSVFDEFQSGRVRAFEIDSLATTRPIEYPVESPDDAAGMFDILTYTKGGAVLRMIEQWLEPEAFRDGIRAYLAAFAFGNADTQDLWDAIETASGQPVRRIMEPWIFQPGYPAISVTLDGPAIRLDQRRFSPSLPDDASTWPVPLLVRQVYPGGERTERVLVEAAGLTLDLADPAATVIANSGSTAFARTFYDDVLRARLVERAMTDLQPAERLSLVDDAWAAVIAGVAPVSSFIDLARAFTSESSPAVWQVIVNGLTWCDRFIDGPARERFRAMVRALVGPALDRLGWEATDRDEHPDRELRGDLIRAMGILGDDRTTQARARAIEDAAGDTHGGPGIDPSVAAAAVDVAAACGDADVYGRFVARMDDAATPQDRDRYRNALATFGDASSMRRTLDLVATGAIRAQDAPFLLYRAMGQRDHGTLAWRFVRDEWLELTSRFAETNVVVLGAGACRLTAADEVAEVQAFFTEDRIPQDRLTMRQQLERQRLFAAARIRIRQESAELFGVD